MRAADVAIGVGALLAIVGAGLVIWLAIEDMRRPAPVIPDGVRFYDTLSPFRLHFRTRNAGIALVCFGTVLLLAGMIASN
jgi:hypothetical protein